MEPLMILTNGKVVGNVVEQWKEVRDNRVKNVAKQDTQAKNGKELAPVDNVSDKQVKTSNKFVALEDVDVGEAQNKQLAIVDDAQEVIQVDKSSPSKGGIQGNARRIPKNTPTGNKKDLNPAAPSFNPNSNEIEATKEGEITSPNERE